MIALLFGLLIGLCDPDQAELAYCSGKYAKALTLYEAALSEPDIPQGPVLYNMGNCAYRMGQYADSVLYYRSAQLRLPRDQSVIFNLHLAEQQLGLDAPSEESFGVAVKALGDSFTPGELLLLVSGLQVVGLTGLVLLRRRRTVRGCMVLLILLALAGATRLVHSQWFAGPPVGLVMASEITLRSEPHTEFAVIFKLNAGEKVRVEEMSDRWIRIRHASGGGWTERAGVGIID